MAENTNKMDLLDFELAFAKIGTLCQMLIEYNIVNNEDMRKNAETTDRNVYLLETIVDFAAKMEKQAEDMQLEYEITALSKTKPPKE